MTPSKLFILKIKIQFIGLFLLGFLVSVSAQDTENKKVDEGLIEDSPIVMALDSLVNIKYFKENYLKTDTNFLNVYRFPEDSIPTYSDSILEVRIQMLNAETPIELTYNKTVRGYINLYGKRKRELTVKMLGLAKVYFPYFEEQLDRHNIPLELKYLAIVESALNPRAGSRVGAKGLWQFMYGTGKAYGLKVSSYVDDRFDPMKSTIAACEHLSDLYDIYNDWNLALAAYNSGAGNVNRAIRRAGGVKNYWAIWPFLPRETRGYVPAFIAVNYIMNYATEHNLYPQDPGILYMGIDTVTVRDALSFDQISELLNIPMDDILFLNPQFKLGVIPATHGKKYILRLPKEHIASYLNNEDSLYRFKSKKGIERDKLLAQILQVKDRSIHRVRSGENLGVIAKRYRCYISQLKKWNNLKGNTIYPGQKLIVYGGGSKIAKSNNPTTYIAVAGSKFLYHTIKKGDTLWDIARAYDGVTVDQIKSLNNIRNSKKLSPGKKIKIALLVNRL